MPRKSASIACRPHSSNFFSSLPNPCVRTDRTSSGKWCIGIHATGSGGCCTSAAVSGDSGAITCSSCSTGNILRSTMMALMKPLPFDSGSPTPPDRITSPLRSEDHERLELLRAHVGAGHGEERGPHDLQIALELPRQRLDEESRPEEPDEVK